MSQSRTVRSPRVPELDGLRGIAILLVLCHHFVWVPRPASLPDHIANAVAALSWMGADLLIVLAGFLVTRILLEVRDLGAPLHRFYGRMALRLLPAYAAFVVAYFHILLPLLGNRFGFNAASAESEHWFWIPVSNWMGLYVPVPFATSHLWAVALLLQFVLVWPLAVRWLSESKLAALCASVVIACLFLRIIYSSAVPPESIRKLTPLRLDAIAFGALAAIIHRRAEWYERGLRGLGSATVAALAAGCALLFLTDGRLSPASLAVATAGLTIIGALSACAIFYATSHGGTLDLGASLLRTRWLILLGRHSYPIYLIHYPISIYSAAFWSDLIRSFETRMTWGIALLSLMVGALVSYAAALLVWNVVERPFARLKVLLPYLPEEEESALSPDRDSEAAAPAQAPEVEPISTSTW